VLRKLCRKCQGNYAVYLSNREPFFTRGIVCVFRAIWYLFLLTFPLRRVILGKIRVLSQEIFMSDEKLVILRQSHTLHPHPDLVRDPLFTSGSPFFDARDLVQVKYELLRRVRYRASSSRDFVRESSTTHGLPRAGSLAETASDRRPGWLAQCS